MLLGKQAPRVRLAPAADWSHAEDAAFLAASYGLTPDEWQHLVITDWLGVKNGRWAASRVGLAVPRQNGKNAILEIVELYKMVALGRRILHTAHEVKTARKAFTRLLSFFENERKYPELAALVHTVRRTNGQEAILLKNGASIEFVARSKGSGRGFTVDDLVCDEAQELSEDVLAALLPTISAAPSGDPQVTMTGTPPAPSMDGEAWTRLRKSGHEGAPRVAWAEWSLPGDVDLDDPRNHAAANPAYGIRLNADTINDERDLMDDETFARERGGVWQDEQATRSVIPMHIWAQRATQGPPRHGKVAYGLDMNPERTMASIGVARAFGSQGAHIEVVRNGSTEGGTRWIVAWFAERKDRGEVVIDGNSPAMALLPDLQKAKVKVKVTTARDMATACGGLYDAAMAEGELSHFDQPALNTALASARKRPIGEAGAWGWARKDTTDITPLVAVTLARHGLMTGKRERSGAATFT